MRARHCPKAALVAAMALLLAMAGCHGPLAGQSAGTTATVAAPSLAELGPVRSAMLGINGFNYTDGYIASFSVERQGGGNIYVSSPTSGGGGTTCCVGWSSATPLPWPLEIEWSRDRKRWCKKTVMFNGPVPAKPTAIGVHFMPDGDIQIELSEGYPKLKLRLENYSDGQRKPTGNVIHDEKTASCRNGH